MSIPLDPGFAAAESKVAGQWERPPAGPYIMKVVEVEEKTSSNNNPMIVIGLDIAEGEHAGAFGEKPTKYYQLTQGNSLPYFKGLISTFRQCNPNANWNQAFANNQFDSRVLVGCSIGAAMREEEYQKDGEIKTTIKPSFLCHPDKVRSGEVGVPKPVKLAPSATQQAPSGWADAPPPWEQPPF